MKQNVKNFILNTIGVSINSFISLFYLIVVTRLNGIDLSGVFSYCYSLSMIMYVISNLGGRTFQIVDGEKKFDDSSYYSVRFLTSVISITITLLFCYFCNYSFYKSLIIIIFIIIRIIESFSDAIYAVFQKNERLDIVGFSLIFKNLLSLVIFIIIDILTKNLLLSVLSIFVSTLIIYIIYDFKNLKKYEKLKILIDYKKMFSLINYIKYFFFFNFLTMFITNAPRFFVDAYFSDSQQGYFGIIMMIPSVMGLFGLLIIQPALVNLTNLYIKKNMKQFMKIVNSIFVIIFIIAVICSLCAYFLGDIVLNILYNINFQNYKLMLVAAVIMGLFNVYTAFVSTLLTMIKKTKIQFILYLSILIIECVLIFINIKLDSFNGVFVGYFETVFLNFLIFYLYFMKKIHIEKRMVNI